MGKLTDFLGGIKILEDVESPINGKITVIQSITFGKYIQVGGLTQSGGIIKTIWNKALKKVSKVSEVPKAPRVLILGLGGGSIVGVIKKYWPEARITAVDIDPTMVKLGKKHLGLEDKNVKIVISDAFEFLTENRSLKTVHFDLILIDLYVGDEFPKKFENEKFLRRTRTVLASSGIAVFNRLYYGEKRSQAVRFGNLLEKIFPKVQVVYPEANIMFVCSSKT